MKIRKSIFLQTAVLAIFLLSGACDSPAPPTATPQPTATSLPTATATNTPTPEPTPSPTAARRTPEPATTQTLVPDVPNAEVPDGASANLLVNGRLQDAAGNPSFDGWEQEPNYWCNWEIHGTTCGLHRPLPQSPSQTWSLQADREFRRLDTWPSECCPEARAWTDVFDVPEHNRLFFGWEEFHHLYAGVMELRVYGFDAAGKMIEIFLQAGTRSASIDSKEDPTTVYLVEIPIPPGGFRGYRVEVYGKLVAEEDGFLVGDLKLITAP